MVKIFSPMAGPNPLAETLRNLGKQMFGDQTANAINNEKLYAAQRENTETDNLMRGIAGGGGAQALAADPTTQARLLGSGYDPNKFNSMALMGGATQFGATDPRTQNLQVGSGQSYDNTAGAVLSKLGEVMRNNNMQSADRRYGVDQSVGEQRHEFDNKPIPALGPDGKPAFVGQGSATASGVQPVLSETDQKGTLLGQNWNNLPSLNPNQQEVLGALPGSASGSRMPKNYIVPNGDGPQQTFITADGVTDLQTGRPLPPGGYIGNAQGSANDLGLTNSVLSEEQGKELAFKDWGATRDQALAVAKDPTAFGFTGGARYVVQQAGQIARNLGLVVGNGSVDQAVAALANEVTDPGTRATIMRELNTNDPNLRALHSLRVLLAYQAAKANGSTGRDLSNNELQANMEAVGDPTAWLGSQDSFLSSLATVDYNVRSRRNARRQSMGKPIDDPLPPFNQYLADFVAKAHQTAPTPGAPPPAAAPQPAPDGSVVIDGIKIRRLN